MQPSSASHIAHATRDYMCWPVTEHLADGSVPSAHGGLPSDTHTTFPARSLPVFKKGGHGSPLSVALAYLDYCGEGSLPGVQGKEKPQ